MCQPVGQARCFEGRHTTNVPNILGLFSVLIEISVAVSRNGLDILMICFEHCTLLVHKPLVEICRHVCRYSKSFPSFSCHSLDELDPRWISKSDLVQLPHFAKCGVHSRFSSFIQ